MRQPTSWWVAVAVASLPGAPLFAQSVTSDMLQKAAASSDWLMYGHNYWNNRYSPLTQITAANVKSLVAKYVLQSGVERLGSFETTPVVVNGVMYVTTPLSAGSPPRRAGSS